MRNVILFIIFLIFTFFINVVFFYVSEDYRNFLQNIKTEKIIINSSDTEKKHEQENILDEEIYENDEDLTIIKPNDKNEEIFDVSDDKKVEIKEEVVLWKNYREIQKLFSSYDLKELEINTNLFDVTTEYPDNYIEYYSKELTLYFFPTKTYREVYDIFKVLEYELPFSINEVNNFWDNSFYINLNNDINDNVVRIVISNKWVAFWLKIKRNEYNLVKEKLNTLKFNQMQDG